MVTKVSGQHKPVVHREKFPRIRTILKHGKVRYQVDPRPHAGQLVRPTLAAAKKLANEIAADYAKLGSEGIDFSTTLRVMALACEQKLNPWKKTIADATAHYIEFLQEQHARFHSKLLTECVDEWDASKRSKTRKTLRADTLRDIRQIGDLLKSLFNGKRIREIERHDIEKYLDSLSVGLRRKENLRNRMGQFFNWCIDASYVERNPCEKFKFIVDNADVAIVTAAEAQRMMAVAESEHPKLVVYVALGLFAGLRPTEAQLLTWEDINLFARQITIRKQITKVKSTRLLQEMQPNLVEWLRVWGEGKTGRIIAKNFTNEVRKYRSKLGYSIKWENRNGKRWTQDILRHSYASYWLPLFQNMHQLAYMMGNSVEIIKKHYETIVPNQTDLKIYWNIIPKSVANERALEAINRDNEARQIAESESNCGRAVKDEDGIWHPVMYESGSNQSVPRSQD